MSSRFLSRIFESIDTRSFVQRLEGVKEILSDCSTPDNSLACADFDKLQSEHPIRPEYGYDPVSTWKRAAERVTGLVSLDGMGNPGRRVLEVACGDGMAGFMLKGYGHEVQLTDLEDWREPRAKEIPFEPCDLGVCLPFADDRFDLVVSYNAFEHFPDPALALKEIVRTCRPVGLMYFEFGPLYASPWGLHAYRSLRMPYPQFLFPREFVLEKLREIGMRDLGRERTELQPMNEWRVGQFETLWESSGCEIISRREYRDDSHLDLVLRYPQCFRGRCLSVDDLCVQALFVCLRKPGKSHGG